MSNSDNNAIMGLEILKGQEVPDVNFPVRVNGDWGNINSTEEFAGKRVIIFGLPGAFTPTCSSQQVPGFQENFKKFDVKPEIVKAGPGFNDKWIINK